jgi:hypothetical protein
VTEALLEDDAPAFELESLDAPQGKVLAETAMLLRVIAEVGAFHDSSLADRAAAAATRLAPLATSGRVVASMCMSPARALDYGAAYICLAELIGTDTILDRCLNETLESPLARSKERVPHRLLEQLWLRSLIGEPGPSDSEIARSSLGRPIEVLSGNREDLYALTHAVIYATDFGRRTIGQPRNQDELQSELRSALISPLDDDDFDLLGELLLLWPLLGLAWGPTECFCLQLLIDLEDELGVIPCLSVDLEAMDALPAGARTAYAVASQYHSAYVMGILSAALLRQLPLNVADDYANGPLLDGLDHRLGNMERVPVWQRRHASNDNDCVKIPRVALLDVLVMRSIRQFRYHQTADLIRIASAEPRAWTAASQQAATLLLRLARSFPSPTPDA